MLDVKAVGSDLTPAQRDETLGDVKFFLDEFGSTRAVRVKLQEQENDIKRLERLVRGESSHEDEGKDEDTAINSGANAVEDVDETMADLDFFLRTFGSTRAVREKLQNQTKEVVALQRTAQRPQRDLNQPAPIVGKDFAPREVVSASFKTFKTANEACSGSKTSSSSSFSGGDIPREQTELQGMYSEAPVATHFSKAATTRTAVNKPARTASRANSNGRTLCRHPGCTKKCQALGLCRSHGGYHICRVEGCDRRAATKYLCPHHGGGTRCSVDACNKLTRSGCKGYCKQHARGQGVVVKRKCKAGGCCNDRGHQGYCQTHRVEAGTSESRTLKLNEYAHQASVQTQPSKPDGSVIYHPPTDFIQTDSKHWADAHRPHKECKTFACKFRAMQDGGLNEYCIKHIDTQSRDNMPRTCKPEIMTSFLHPETNPKQVDSTVSEDLGGKRKRSMCKEPGCKRIGKDDGAKKGYCFRHGGGITCSHQGCTKARKVRGVCAEHGGFYECQVEGCNKHVHLRGYCYAHNRERSALAKRLPNEEII